MSCKAGNIRRQLQKTIRFALVSKLESPDTRIPLVHWLLGAGSQTVRSKLSRERVTSAWCAAAYFLHLRPGACLLALAIGLRPLQASILPSSASGAATAERAWARAARRSSLALRVTGVRSAAGEAGFFPRALRHANSFRMSHGRAGREAGCSLTLWAGCGGKSAT